MVECGIEKYDELPGRVALIDVDAHRRALHCIRNDGRLWSVLNRLPLMIMYHRISADAIEEEAIESLEEARKIHAGETQPFYAKWIERVAGKFRNTSEGDPQSN